MDRLYYLFVAYVVIWVLIGGYLLNIAGRLKKLEQDKAES